MWELISEGSQLTDSQLGSDLRHLNAVVQI